jgi:hypothetical protein
MSRIFGKGDTVIFDGHEREVVCCDDEVAILGLVIRDKYDCEGNKLNDLEKSVNYECLVAVSNQKEFEDTIDFKIIKKAK